jgi:hypothetical protein
MGHLKHQKEKPMTSSTEANAAARRTWTPDEIADHRHEMKAALDDGLISQREYDGQMQLMDEQETAPRQADAPERVWFEFDDDGRIDLSRAFTCGDGPGAVDPPSDIQYVRFDLAAHVHDFKQVEGQSSTECACGAVPDYVAAPSPDEQETAQQVVNEWITSFNEAVVQPSGSITQLKESFAATLAESRTERNELREYYDAHQAVEEGVANFDLHREAVARLERAAKAVRTRIGKTV